MHVAIDGRVINDHFPGIGRYVYHLAEALGRRTDDHRFSLIAGSERTASSRFDVGSLASEDGLAIATIDAPVFSLRSQWRVPRALRQLQANVFHATYWVTAYRPGVPTILSVYDTIGLDEANAVPPARRAALRFTLQMALRSAAGVITLSEAARQDIVRVFGIAPERISVTPLAADQRFRPQPEDAVRALRARLGLPDAFVLYVGSNKPHKNLALLQEAWRSSALQGDGDGDGATIPLILAGSRDPRYAPFGSRPQPGVRDLGPIEERDLPTLYAAATLFVFPSVREGFGLPALEAMASGTPVLASHASSLPEVVGNAGVLLPPDDAAAWAHAIRGLWNEPARRHELAGMGIARASEFHWDRTADLTLAAYKKAASSAKAAS